MSDIENIGGVLFLSANTPWVNALARSTAELGIDATSLYTYDWRTKGRGPKISSQQESFDRFSTSTMVLPPGYAGRFSKFFKSYVQKRINKLIRDFDSNATIWVVAPYPYNVPWLNVAENVKIAYYNLDDYELYDPARADQISRNEQLLIDRADLVIALAKTQTKKIQSKTGDPDKVYHFPLGVLSEFINTQNRSCDQNTVTFVGGLSDRVDWGLVQEVAAKLPEFEFRFVGSLEKMESGGSQKNWELSRDAAFSMGNVVHVGPVQQYEVKQWYWKSAINWVPYSVAHPFNRASCPTKIMDGIASGRPMLSTEVPECLLYPDWISTHTKAEDFVLSITSNANVDWNEQQIEFAEQNTWLKRADEFVQLIYKKS